MLTFIQRIRSYSYRITTFVSGNGVPQKMRIQSERSNTSTICLFVRYQVMNLIFGQILTEIPKQGAQFRCFNKHHTQHPKSPHTLPFHLKMPHTKCLGPIIVEKEKLVFKQESLSYPLISEKLKQEYYPVPLRKYEVRLF